VDSGRGFIRDLYVACRRQREVLAAALRAAGVGVNELFPRWRDFPWSVSVGM
jgi:hypothetical protein